MGTSTIAGTSSNACCDLEVLTDRETAAMSVGGDDDGIVATTAGEDVFELLLDDDSTLLHCSLRDSVQGLENNEFSICDNMVIKQMLPFDGSSLVTVMRLG